MYVLLSISRPPAIPPHRTSSSAPHLYRPLRTSGSPFHSSLPPCGALIEFESERCARVREEHRGVDGDILVTYGSRLHPLTSTRLARARLVAGLESCAHPCTWLPLTSLGRRDPLWLTLSTSTPPSLCPTPLSRLLRTRVLLPAGTAGFARRCELQMRTGFAIRALVGSPGTAGSTALFFAHRRARLSPHACPLSAARLFHAARYYCARTTARLHPSGTNGAILVVWDGNISVAWGDSILAACGSRLRPLTSARRLLLKAALGPLRGAQALAHRLPWL
ncbi:hypothetical protein C8J57DRAFT_1706355 [Mycena rebaudengoi]|nr:hypothetical protein C8J57DRAFT_1706355 [Mycena rebaudengoi]